MEAGSTFHFGSNAPTGWEAPFPEGAFLYIVKRFEKGLDHKAIRFARAHSPDFDEILAGGNH